MQFSYTYLKKILYEQKVTLILLFVFCFIFTFVYMWVFFDTEIGPLIDVYFKLLPEPMKKVIGFQSGDGMFGVTMIAFGYRHPLLIILLSAVTLNLASRYISFEIENKTFDLILTRSIHRSVIITHLYILMMFFILTGLAGLLSGTSAGFYIFNLSEYLVLWDYFKIAFVGFFFFLCIGAFSLLVSTLSNERGKALIIVLSVLVLLFFIDSIIRVTDSLSFLEPFSFFELYRPVKIVLKQKDILDTVPQLIFFNVVFFAASFRIFKKRDL